MRYEVAGNCTRLAGSVHLRPASVPSLPDCVWSAYQRVETIIFEHDTPIAKDHVLLKEGDPLESHLPLDLWNKLAVPAAFRTGLLDVVLTVRDVVKHCVDGK